MDIGAVLLILAVILLISIFISRPFFDTGSARILPDTPESDEIEHKRSSLLAEYDQTLSAIQELEFDHTLGKIPAEEYPQQRLSLLESASNVLHQLDDFQEKTPQLAVEDRIEAAISARRVTTAAATPAANATPPTAEDPVEAAISAKRMTRAAEVNTTVAAAAVTTAGVTPAVEVEPPAAKEDEVLETLIAMRRGARQTKAGGFCPRCGRPVQKSDRFCPKCGAAC